MHWWRTAGEDRDKIRGCKAALKSGKHFSIMYIPRFHSCKIVSNLIFETLGKYTRLLSYRNAWFNKCKISFILVYNLCSWWWYRRVVQCIGGPSGAPGAGGGCPLSRGNLVPCVLCPARRVYTCLGFATCPASPVPCVCIL